MDNWKNIRLELARTESFPTGSVSRAYLIQLPVDDQYKVDKVELARSPARARVRRHWAVDPDERGVLVPIGDEWAMRCNGNPDRFFQLNGHAIRLGQHISIVEHDGTVLPFKITSVR